MSGARFGLRRPDFRHIRRRSKDRLRRRHVDQFERRRFRSNLSTRTHRQDLRGRTADLRSVLRRPPAGGQEEMRPRLRSGCRQVSKRGSGPGPVRAAARQLHADDPVHVQINLEAGRKSPQRQQQLRQVCRPWRRTVSIGSSSRRLDAVLQRVRRHRDVLLADDDPRQDRLLRCLNWDLCNGVAGLFNIF